MLWSIERWDESYESATHICELAKICFPRIPSVMKGMGLEFLKGVSIGCEQSRFVVKIDDVIYGFAFLSTAASHQFLQLVGGVHPERRRRGIGRHLLEHILESMSAYNGKIGLISRAFLDEEYSIGFFTHFNFREVDRLIWSKRSVFEPFSEKSYSKLASFEASNLRMITGNEFERVRKDWRKVWWSFTMETCSDIPSKISFEEIPFEEWKHFLDPPMLNRKHSIVMLDGMEMIGLLNLGEVEDGNININYTAVKSDYRRRGLSRILKMKAFVLAKAYGAQYVTTQNHHLNPMLHINKKLGFVEEAIDVSFKKMLS
jgi:ribosomal protein S18 acetylase RimI-like enzyme